MLSPMAMSSSPSPSSATRRPACSLKPSAVVGVKPGNGCVVMAGPSGVGVRGSVCRLDRPRWGGWSALGVLVVAVVGHGLVRPAGGAVVGVHARLLALVVALDRVVELL